MVREEKTLVYQYDELPSAAAKEKARAWMRKVLEEDDMPFLKDDLTEVVLHELKKKRIVPDGKIEVLYSLGYSQGDGVCFTGSFGWKKYNVTISHIARNYYHSRSTDITLYLKKDGEEIDYDDKAYDAFKKIYYEICRVAEKAGYAQIEYQSSDENAIETIRANEYEFDGDGNRW